jgi:hypothetical protein
MLHHQRMSSLRGLPLHLRQCIEAARQGVLAHPRHHLAFVALADIYEAIGPLADPQSLQVRGRLAINTARSVLALFQHPHDSSRPHRALGLAERLLANQDVTRRTRIYLEMFYHYIGNEWNVDVPLSQQSHLAGRAAERTLALIYNAITRADYQPLFYQRLAQPRPYIAHRVGSAWHDEEAWYTAIDDPVIVAAVACACDPTTDAVQPRQLGTFWMWWLMDALPAAWANTLPPKRPAIGD